MPKLDVLGEVESLRYVLEAPLPTSDFDPLEEVAGGSPGCGAQANIASNGGEHLSMAASAMKAVKMTDDAVMVLSKRARARGYDVFLIFDEASQLPDSGETRWWCHSVERAKEVFWMCFERLERFGVPSHFLEYVHQTGVSTSQNAGRTKSLRRSSSRCSRHSCV